MEELKRKNSGITLVALVVTIIVLLILAGVSLSLIGGSDGILARATNAVDKHEIATIKENVELKIAEDIEKFHEEKYVDFSIDNSMTAYEYLKEKTDKTIEKGDEKYTIMYIDSTDLSNPDDNKIQVNYVKKGTKLSVTGRITQKGVITWDDEIEIGTPDEPEKENPITATATAEYVGTSSCTIKVDAMSTEGNIIDYQYKLNNEPVEAVAGNTFTIENLEPTTDYTISATVTDENGNQDTISTQITTKARTYIIKDGIQQVQGQALRSAGTQENGYFKIVTDSTTKRAFYYFLYDLSNYKKVKEEVEIINKGSSCQVNSGIVDSNADLDSISSYVTGVTFCGPGISNLPKTIFEISVKDLSGIHKFVLGKNATSPATSATLYIYNLWLEE